MPYLLLFFNTGEIEPVDIDELEYLESGGEAELYLYNYKNNMKLVLKVFGETHTNIAKPLERITHIAKRLRALGKDCYENPVLSTRGLPVALGAFEGRAVLAYKYLEGFQPLSDILSLPDATASYVEKMPEEERRRNALGFLRSLACFEEADVVHVDLTSANIAYAEEKGAKGIYMFDFETAALRGEPSYPIVTLPARDAFLLPVESLRDIGVAITVPESADLPLPASPLEASEGVLAWSIWIPLWYGLQLAAYIYAGISLFYGLRVLDPRYWKEIVDSEKEKGFPGGWPPISMLDAGYLDYDEYTSLAKQWRTLHPRFPSLAYKVFVEYPGSQVLIPNVSLSNIFL